MLGLTVIVSIFDVLISWHKNDLSDVHGHCVNDEVIDLGDDLKSNEVFDHILDLLGCAHLVPIDYLCQNSSNELHQGDQEWERNLKIFVTLVD